MIFKKITLIFLIFNLCNCDELTKLIEQKYGCNEKIDYIVVGLGNAGGLMAKRLSDDNKTAVLALHRGKNLTENPIIKFSKFSALTVSSVLFGDSILYETGLSTEQTSADGNKLLWALAKPEGGASSINAGAYCRETNEVNAKWRAIAGPNWSIDRITKLYRELETYIGRTNNPEFHGFHGPITVFQDPKPNQVSQKFTKAIIQATGYPFVLDYNDPLTPIGASSQLQYSHSGKDGVLRVSSATAFLNDNVVDAQGNGVNGRKLKILLEAYALKILWSGNKAIGVEYLQNGKKHKVFANKGVVVCAGLFSSPFLMHSGIGSKALLNSLNIPVIVDNPNVGQGLADQPRVTLVFTNNPKDKPLGLSNGLFNQIAWLPEVTGLNKTNRIYRFATITAPIIPGITICAFDLCQPKSRGSITIASSDPLQPPIIDLGILSNQDDLNDFVKGIQVYVKNINNALKAYPGYQLLLPDPALIDDTNLLIEFIKNNIGSNQHFQSHCRMAPLDKGGVVNSIGKVYGTQNVYVADDSIVPLAMDGSPMASAYLMAANVSDLIIKNNK